MSDFEHRFDMIHKSLCSVQRMQVDKSRRGAACSKCNQIIL